MLTGRVFTEDDVPLSEVNISFAETPYNILAQTNVSGYLSTLGVCADQQVLLVTKAGFVPVKQKATVLTPTTATITVKLELAGKPGFCVNSNVLFSISKSIFGRTLLYQFVTPPNKDFDVISSFYKNIITSIIPARYVGELVTVFIRLRCTSKLIKSVLHGILYD